MVVSNEFEQFQSRCSYLSMLIIIGIIGIIVGMFYVDAYLKGTLTFQRYLSWVRKSLSVVRKFVWLRIWGFYDNMFIVRSKRRL